MDYQKTGDIDFHQALTAIWEVVHAGNKFIDSSAPWVLQKEGKLKEIAQVLYFTADALHNIAILIAPFLPATSREIWNQLGLTKKLKWENQQFKNIAWGKMPSVTVTAGRPVFPRIEPPSPAATAEQGKSPLPRHTASGQASKGEGHLTQETKMELDITEFQKLDLRVAEIRQAEKVEGADKLLKLQIDLGGEMRQIIAGIAQHYTPEQLVGKSIVVVANLRPATIRGQESRGMLLAASNPEGLSIVTLDRPLAPGAKVK